MGDGVAQPSIKVEAAMARAVSALKGSEETSHMILASDETFIGT